MGLFDSIKDAASSVVDKVGDGIDTAKKAAATVVKKVEQAPAAIAHGAKQALEGAKDFGKNLVKDPIGTVKSAAKQAVEGAKNIGRKVVDGAKAAGKWAWEHKAEIGFWVGTTALMLAVPVSGGASGALAGGLMAARGAAIAARVAQAGRVGAGAVRLASAGAKAVGAAKTAIGATKVGAGLARTGNAIHAGRVALGGTRVGKAMIAAQKPVTAASTVLAGVNFADTSRKYAKGEASNKDLALATLGFAPTGVAAVRGIAAKRAAAVNAKAAEVVTGKLDDVAAKAANATDDVAHVATVAPKVDAPLTAGAAAEARDEALGTLDKARRLRDRAALTSRSAEADDAISATTLARELDDVAARARTARVKAADAEDLAPDPLTPAATAARERLEGAAVTAENARNSILKLADKQQRADLVAERAETLETAIGTTSLHANIINNGLKSAHEQHGWSLTDGSFARGIATWLLGRNAARAATTPNYIPPPQPAPARAA